MAKIILGMGERRADPIGLIHDLLRIEPELKSLANNVLAAIPCTPPGQSPPIGALDLARARVLARIVQPTSSVRISARRDRAPRSDKPRAGL